MKKATCRFLLWMWHKTIQQDLTLLPSEFFGVYWVSTCRRPVLLQLHTMCREEILHLHSLSRLWLGGCQSLLETFILRLLEPPPERDSSAQRIQLAIDWMQKHLESQEPVGRLCDYLGVSQPTLHRLFRIQAGTSPSTYFQKLKMNRARHALAAHDTSVKQVAYTLGYRHFNDFSRAYKRHFGVSPTNDSHAKPSG